MEPKRVRLPFTWTLRPVLAEDITTKNIDTVNVFVDHIIDQKSTSKIVKDLAELSAITSLKHLKRVKKQTVILMLANNMKPDQCVMELKSKGFNFTGLSGQPSVIPVPRSMPKTCAQNQQVRELWPCNFHPDKRLESILSGKFFDQLQLAIINGHMKTALERAVTTGIGAVVVDPCTNVIVAQSGDFRYYFILCYYDRPIFNIVSNNILQFFYSFYDLTTFLFCFSTYLFTLLTI